MAATSAAAMSQVYQVMPSKSSRVGPTLKARPYPAFLAGERHPCAAHGFTTRTVLHHPPFAPMRANRVVSEGA
jgi:hypothetical protein